MLRRQPRKGAARPSRTTTAPRGPAPPPRIVEPEVPQPFLAVQPQAYFVDYLPAGQGCREYYVDYARDLAVGAQYLHRFCGPHDLPGAGCRNCLRPMLRFLALDTRDPRLNLGDVPFSLLSLVYCWRCPVAQDAFSYRILADGDVELLQTGRGDPEDDFPYTDYPDFFPEAPARLIQLTDEAQDLLRGFNGEDDGWVALRRRAPQLMVCRHQYGGEPFLIQRDTEYRLDCPSCRAAMPFLASIGDDCLDPRGFTENEFVQVIYHFCRACHTVSAFQQCD